MRINTSKAAGPRRTGATKTTGGKHQLVDAIAEEVSTVDRPAIAESFYLVKNAAGKGKPATQAKADPPAPPAQEGAAPAEETAPSTMTAAEFLQGLGAYMEGLIAVANSVEATGQMDAPVPGEAIDAVAELSSQFAQAIGFKLGGEEETEEGKNKEAVAASAPDPAKEAPVSQTKTNGGVAKRSIKLTGDKATRFEVAMEILGGLNVVPSGEEETPAEVTQAATPATPAAPSKAPAKPQVSAKKNEEGGGEEMPKWAQGLASAVIAIGKEVRELKRAGAPAPTAKGGTQQSVGKSLGVSNAVPVDGHGEDHKGDDDAWPRDLNPRRRTAR